MSIHVNLILRDDAKDGQNRLIILLVLNGCSSTGKTLFEDFDNNNNII